MNDQGFNIVIKWDENLQGAMNYNKGITVLIYN